jgi:hypothetical protein
MFHIPAYVLAIFDGEGTTATVETTETTTETTPVTQATRTRESNGRFVVPNTDDPKELRRALEDLNRNYERDLTGAQSRIGELNAENEKHRNRFKDTKTALDAVSSQVQASNQRVLRADARDALTAAGALSSRVVDLFLADMGDKVKIDPKTGEPTGIAEALPEWKTANSTFFKAERATETEAARGNSTARGASAAADATTTTTTTGGMPDLTTLTPVERKAAIKAYKNSLRR